MWIHIRLPWVPTNPDAGRGSQKAKTKENHHIRHSLEWEVSQGWAYVKKLLRRINNQKAGRLNIDTQIQKSEIYSFNLEPGLSQSKTEKKGGEYEQVKELGNSQKGPGAFFHLGFWLSGGQADLTA